MGPSGALIATALAGYSLDEKYPTSILISTAMPRPGLTLSRLTTEIAVFPPYFFRMGIFS
jgi:hypothetical protein